MIKLAKEIYRDFVTDGVPASGANKPIKPDIRAWGSWLEPRRDPRGYGAAGDGSTDDSADYASAEAANESIVLGPNTTFNLGTQIPAKPVYGAGQLKIGDDTLGGYQLLVDVERSTIYCTPSDFTETIDYPVAPGPNKGVLIGSGAVLQGLMNRFVGIGSCVFQKAVSIDRCVAIGDGNMQFTRYADRHTGVGTTNSQWLGADKATTMATHPWWTPVPPSDPTWNFNGMETRNPGIGALIAASTSYATVVTDVGRSVAVGRDAMGGAVWEQNSVGVGYRALGSYVGNNNTAVGNDAFWQGVFLTESTAVGQGAGRYWQQGTRNLAVGRFAANAVVRGDRSLHIGPYAGINSTDSSDNLFLGYGAGNALSGTNHVDMFIVANVHREYLISGNFNTGALGANINPVDIRAGGGGLHLFGSSFSAGVPESPSGAASTLILETAGNTGMTIRAAATGLATIAFARTGQATRGVIQYNFTSDFHSFQVAATERMGVGTGVIIGAPTGSYKGLGTLNATAVYDDNVLLTCYPIEAANTGTIDQAAWDSAAPAGGHKAAKRFADERMKFLDVDEFIRFWRMNGHLPSLPGAEEWKSHARDAKPLGEMVQRLWETVDLLAVHIAQIREA